MIARMINENLSKVYYILEGRSSKNAIVNSDRKPYISHIKKQAFILV